MTDQLSPTESRQGRNTGWAIGAAIGLSLIFFVVYLLLFSLVVASFASYDSTFASGLGAWVLLVIGPNVLGFISGTVASKALFKQANTFAMFYGIATFITVIGTFLIASHFVREDGSWMAVASLAINVVASIIGVRIVLASPD